MDLITGKELSSDKSRALDTRESSVCLFDNSYQSKAHDFGRHLTTQLCARMNAEP